MKKDKKDVKMVKKIGKVILTIAAIFIVLYIINIIRNNIILSDVLEKESKILSSKNIYYEMTNNANVELKFYKKDEIEMFDINTNGHKIIKWRNTNTNEGMVVSPDTKIATNVKAEQLIGFNIPLLVHSINDIAEYKKYAILSSIIYTDKNCYVIVTDFYGRNKTWVDKETGIVVKRQSGTIKTEDNESIPMLTYYNNWRVNELSEEEVSKPDTSGFDIKQ